MDIKYSDSYLESLIGKEVQVNKGGPESKRGVIKNVKPDYLVLSCNDNRLICYQTKHIKSLIENSKTNLSQSTEDAVDLDTPAHFVNMLDTLVSETVQVNQGGPESKVGKLLSVKQDFFVLLTKEDGNVCYLIDHVKSISLVQGKESEKENQKENVEIDTNLLTEETKVNIENLEEYYKDIDNLDELLSQMEYSLVSINRGGPEKIVGVLVNSSEDFLTIVVNEDVIRTSKFHLKSISQIINKEDSKDSSKDEKEQSTEAKKEAQSENKDKGKNNESREKNDKNDKKDSNHVSNENNNTINGKEKKDKSKENKKDGKEKEDKENKKDDKEKEDKKNKKDDKEKEDKKNKKDDKEKEDKKNKKDDKEKEDKKK